MVKDYVKDYYLKELKRVLGNKKLSLEEVVKRMKKPRPTVMRWVDLFSMGGILGEEFRGHKKFIWIKRKD